MGRLSILCFSAFLLKQPGFTKDQERGIRGASHHTLVDNPVLVANGNENAHTTTSHSPKKSINTISYKQLIREMPSSRKVGSNHVSLIRGQFQNRGLSTTATKILDGAWRTGTRKQYDRYLEEWKQYCAERKINPFPPSVEEWLNFLAELFEKGLGYSGLNTARSAFRR